MDFATMMALEPHGPDTFVGIGPKYPWGGLYGGQIVAQALRAASLTVEPGHPGMNVHSCHAYFIRRGDHEEPIRFEVDRVRNGRSFVTRNVIARQAVGAILSMSASFQVAEPGPEAQSAEMPAVPKPEQLEIENWGGMFDRALAPAELGSGRAIGWLRMRDDVGDDPLLQACALAYLSDDLPTDAVVLQHPNRPRPHEWESQKMWSASLDHAIWFHRPLRAEQWHLQDFTCHGFMTSRGLAVGHVFTADATHVATIAQEVLLRFQEQGKE
jgi:acyl-CoA thioesterase-2